MDCVAQPGGDLRPLMGGSPFNMARAAALRGADVAYLNPLSMDRFGDRMRAQLEQDGVRLASPPSRLPTSLAVVQVEHGQPSYGFYREGIADRDYQVEQILGLLAQQTPGILHTGSLLLVPPEDLKVAAVLRGARALGWTISLDVNMRPKLAVDLPRYIAGVWEAAALAHWIKASDEDLEILGLPDPQRSGAAQVAARFRALGASRIALTYGADGAWLGVDDACADMDVPAVTVVDAVGAGDTFWGNCVGDWALHPDGASRRVAATLAGAVQAAAINCTRAGCQPPRHAQVLAAMGTD
jgi:fructokinase